MIHVLCKVIGLICLLFLHSVTAVGSCWSLCPIILLLTGLMWSS